MATLATVLGAITGCGGGSEPPADVQGEVQTVAAFGDSFSDVGTFRWGIVAATGGGRFTTDPGPTWVELVAAHYGYAIGPYRLGGAGNPAPATLGGLGYAEGGARVSQLPGVGRTPSGIDGIAMESEATPIAQQVSNHLARGRIPSTQLVLVQGGTNDLFFEFAALNQRVAGGQPFDTALAQARGAMGEAAEQLAAQADRLVRGGASNVVVLTMPDPALLLFASGLPPGVRDTLTTLANKFNQTLATATARLPGVLYVDLHPLMTELVTRPGLHGITEVGRPACRVPSVEDPQALLCSTQTLVQPDAAERFLFADGVHLTSAGNRAKANYVLQRIGALSPR